MRAMGERRRQGARTTPRAPSRVEQVVDDEAVAGRRAPSIVRAVITRTQ